MNPFNQTKSERGVKERGRHAVNKGEDEEMRNNRRKKGKGKVSWSWYNDEEINN